MMWSWLIPSCARISSRTVTLPQPAEARTIAWTSPLPIIARIIVELCSVYVLRGNNSFECRLDDFLRRGRDDVEVELVAFGKSFQSFRKQLNVVLQADLLSCLDQVMAPHTAEFRIMQDQVRELSALLYQVDLGQSPDFVMEPMH